MNKLLLIILLCCLNSRRLLAQDGKPMIRCKSVNYLFYPQPFIDTITLHLFSQPENLLTVSIYNAKGLLVFTRRFNNDSTPNRSFDLFELDPGIYVFKMEFTGRQMVERVTKTGKARKKKPVVLADGTSAG